jgi:glycosyltransferase involved in cell wall biosynthesis
MNDNPDVSVVMSVYNGAQHLPSSVDSILSQEGVTLELIIVNDGSTDDSAGILEDYTRLDDRVRIIQQPNEGLTRALIKGCGAAGGTYIARHDVGDISSPKRLIKQLRCMREQPGVALVSCGTRFVGPNREHLYDVNPQPAEALTRLMTLDLNQIKGPSHHGSTLFSKQLYETVGGYRSSFYFAQDLDLWIRLAENGRHIIMPEVLYQALVDVASISGLYRKEQIETAKVILDCASRRRNGMSEAPALEKARAIRPSIKRRNNRLGRARALYFIGVCLKKRRDPVANDYFKQALIAFPFHVKSAARLLLG